MTSADFAAAQKRVAARRQQREAQNHERLAVRQQAIAAGPLSRLPPAAQTAWAKISSQWDLVCGREGTRPAFRVGQVDAELLDEELLGLLKEQVGEALKYYGTHLRDDYAPEILLSLRAILFKLTIWDHNASYGASLQNLRYIDARHASPASVPPQPWQKAIYGLVSVGGRYVWSKWEDYLLDAEGGYEEPSARIRALSRFSSLLSTTHSIAAFTSFLFFLVNGKYRTILDRLLRLRLTPTTNQVHREVSFEYLNRQLVWHAFTEFLLFLLPLVGISRWRRWLSRAWRKTQSLFRRGGGADTEEDLKAGGELGFLPERTCAICYQDQNPSTTSEADMAALSGTSGGVIGSSQTDITNPYQTIPCGCIYCYLCIAHRLEAEDGEGWTCLRCGEIVKECKPWDGDVLEEPRSSSGSGKAVTFAEDEEDERGFKKLDPMPMEDEKMALMEKELLGEVDEQATSRSLLDSGDWTRTSDDDGVEQQGVEEAGTDEDNDDDDDALDGNEDQDAELDADDIDDDGDFTPELDDEDDDEADRADDTDHHSSTSDHEP